MALLPAAPTSQLTSVARSSIDAAERRRVILLIVGWKLLTLLVIGLVIQFDEPNMGLRQTNSPFKADSEWEGNLASWDAANYLVIAEDGYLQTESVLNAFSPMLPFLIKPVNLIVGNVVISGMIVANLASGLGLYLFYLFVRLVWRPSTAMASLVLLMTFPTAFFLNVPYSESVFLLFSAAFLYLLYRGNEGLAGIAAFFLPLTRFLGVIYVVPYAIYFFESRKLNPLTYLRAVQRGDGASQPRMDLDLLALPFLGILFAMCVMYLLTGDMLAQPHSANLSIARWELGEAWNPIALFNKLFTSDIVWGFDYLNSAIDRGFFIAFVASLPLVYRRVDKTLLVFCLIMGLQPLLGSFFCYPRYMLLALPLFIAYAQVLEKRPPLLFAVAAIGLVAQAFLLWRWETNLWVA